MISYIKTITSVFVCLLILLGAHSVHAQQGYYMHIDYIKIEKENLSDFKNHVNSTFKPIQEARVENESIEGWYLYEAVYRGTRNANYNYVVVSISSSISGFEDISSQISNHFTENDGTEIMENYNLFLTPNHSELWTINNSVLTGDDAKPSRYIGMDYMKVTAGQEYAYQMMEDEVARPLHEHRMENGTMMGWELFALITPGGTNYGYDFATGNYYNKLSDIEFGFTDEIIRANHPNTNIAEFFDDIERTRDLVRSELWELVDYVK